MGDIYQAISKTMADIGAVSKSERNTQQGYMYRGIDQIMNALNPAMIKNGIFVAPEVLDHTREERTTAKGTLLIYSVVTVKYTFYASDGSFVEAVTMGEGMDSGDKATNKAMAAALKYACFQVFMIPTEEMIDSEKDSPEPLPKKSSSAPKADGKAKTDEMITDRQKGLIVNKCKEDGNHKLTTSAYLESLGYTKLDQCTKHQASELISRLNEV